MLRFFLIAAVCLGFAGTAAAQDSSKFAVSASALRDQCQATVRMQIAHDTNDHSHVKDLDPLDSSACLGYVLGTIDAILAGGVFVKSADGKTSAYIYRFTASIHAGQAEEVFMKYLQDHPETEMQVSARSVLILSWLNAKLLTVE
jgi:hypothetical protein